MPSRDPVPGVVTFTARGNGALEQLVDALVAECDGFPASIADVLEQVLEADIEDLADSFSQSAQPAPPASLVVDELGPPAESSDDAARRRLSRAAGRELRRRCASPALDPVAARRRLPRCARHGHPRWREKVKGFKDR